MSSSWINDTSLWMAAKVVSCGRLARGKMGFGGKSRSGEESVLSGEGGELMSSSWMKIASSEKSSKMWPASTESP
jgi:hypothetical protein